MSRLSALRSQWRRSCAGFAVVTLAALATPAVPSAAASDVLFALTEAGELISVRSDTPGVPYSRKRLTGVPTDAAPLSLTTRPGTGDLIAGMRQGGQLVLYTVNPATGAASRLAPGSAQIGQATVDAATNFEPDGRTARVLTSAGKHLMVNAASGGATTLAAPAYAPGDPGEKTKPEPAGLATLPTGEVLVLDAARKALARLGDDVTPPSAGTLTTLGLLPFSIESRGALSVSPEFGRLFAAVTDAGQRQSNLYVAEPGSLLLGYTGPFPDKDTVTGLAVGAGGLFDFDRATYRAREADGAVRVVIQRSGTTFAAADVAFEIQGDTATPGTDFPPSAGVIAFAPGQREIALDLPVTPDSEPEGEEWAKVRLTQTGGPAGFGYRRQSRVAIVDGGVSAPTKAPAAASSKPPATAKPPKTPTTAASTRLTLTMSAPRVKTLGRTLKLPFRCSTACRVVVDAKLDRRSARRIRRPASLGRGTRTLKKAGRATVTIKIPRYSKRLRKIRRGTITYTVRGFGATKKTPQTKFTVRGVIRR